MSESDGARLLGQMSLLFVIFALPAGFIGGKIGRKNTILIGLSLMILLTGAMYVITPRNTDHRTDQAADSGRGTGRWRDPDGGGHCLGLCQYQFTANGCRSDHA